MNYFNSGIKKVVKKLSKGKHNILKLIGPKSYNSICIILMYHQIINEVDNKLGPYSSNSISIKEFERQLKYLKNNFNLISINELIYVLENNRQLPEKTAAITFDDGYKDNLINVFPLLKKYNVPATIYVTTGFIGSKEVPFEYKLADILKVKSYIEFEFGGKTYSYKLNSYQEKAKAYSVIKNIGKNCKKYKRDLLLQLISNFKINEMINKNLFMNWDELKQIANEKLITIGAHTHTHPLLTILDKDEVMYEVLISKKILERKLEISVENFSYPYGGFNSKITKQVKKIGFKTAVTTKQDIVREKHKNHLYNLPRIEVQNINKLKKMIK